MKSLDKKEQVTSDVKQSKCVKLCCGIIKFYVLF